MSISFHLANFPLLCQLHEDPGHQYPDINADMDCVPTSIAAALTWFTGQQYYGDEIIDSVYGSGYQGGTAAVQYQTYCTARGVKLFPVNGTPAELVTAIHTYLHENSPVLVTVPGHWNDPATSGTNPGAVTHVMVVCGDGPASLQVMNPWTGAFEEYSDSWFHVKLCYGQIWPMEKKMGVSWSDDGVSLTAPNGVKVTGALRAYIVENQWDDNNWPLAPAEHRTDILDGSGNAVAGTEQVFRGYGLWYKDAYDGIYLSWPGTELLATRAQLAKAQSDLAAEQAEVVKLTAQVQQLQALLQQAPSGNATDSAALDELAHALPMLARALSSRAASALPASVGAQTKPLPAVQ